MTETTDSIQLTEDMYNYANNVILNPSILIILCIVLVAYFMVFSHLGNSESSSSGESDSAATTIILVVIAGLFAMLAMINGVQYFFGIDVIAKVKDIFSGNPVIDITIDQSKITSSEASSNFKVKPQVFNIPGNNYVYGDAKALCSAYGARLATYSEVEQSHNDGAEWCNYGWSDGQMALFPTQQKTFDGLQKIEGHENDCGRPGINGGYMANPALKFGVNCFGNKPEMTPDEEDLMAHTTPYPKTRKDMIMEQRVEYWKNRLTDILVSPFNYTNWNKL